MQLQPLSFALAIRGFTLVLLLSVPSFAQTDVRPSDFANSFVREIKPLIARYCSDCHTGDEAEAEVDLASFNEITELQKQTKVWQKVLQILETRQMPPKDSDQPSDQEREVLEKWVRSFLMAEAEAHAGDPGPVTLRRLSNAEYTYTIQDLTGVESLNPAREFPVDGAAGEGFTNTGDALVMSPSLVQKYLAAAKVVASHAVLGPDGISFSQYSTERDWTDERLQRIQRFYAKYTDTGGGSKISMHGLTFDTDQGGRLPLETYLRATIALRDNNSLNVIQQYGLNAKYFDTLWRALADESVGSFLVMKRIRERWRVTRSDNVAELADLIRGWQKALWQFNVVGHVGRSGTASRWMEPRFPLQTRQEFRLELPKKNDGDELVVYFAANIADKTGDARVVWRNARLEVGDQTTIPLSHAVGLQQRINKLRERRLAATARYLAAAAELQTRANPSSELVSESTSRHSVELPVLHAWLEYLSIGKPDAIEVSGHFTKKIFSTGGYDTVTGWGSSGTPSIVANASDKILRIPGDAPPHSVLGHPSPTHFVATGWQSPISGIVRVEAHVSDAHGACGNGQQWMVRHDTGKSKIELWSGEFGVRGSEDMPAKTVSVCEGDLVSFILMPRSNDFECDLTHFNLTVTELDGDRRVWDLTNDVAPNITASNPHVDSYGARDVWHLYSGKVEDVLKHNLRSMQVPSDSLMAAWQHEQNHERKRKLAEQIAKLAIGHSPRENTSDALLYQQLRSLTVDVDIAVVLQDADADDRFQAGDLPTNETGIIEFRLPKQLAEGRSLVVTATVESPSTIAQFDVSMTPPELNEVSPSRPIVAKEDGNAFQSIHDEFGVIRELFPPALCYARIVPIDEVVTLTLFFREDDLLQRLMLDDADIAELNRLWDELLYVSQEPLKYEVAFEQLREFSTQDRPDHVEGWKIHVERTENRIAKFRQRLLETENAHLQAVLDFASSAWRKPISTTYEDRIREDYNQLRQNQLTHNEAIRLTLARVLTAPAFLYRLETPGNNEYAEAVSSHELTNRLSYFLWSSMPDEELLRLANDGELRTHGTLTAQTKRMLNDARTRRLAIQFACQWLDIRDFDRNVEKNEKLFPKFKKLRGHMYEESVRFFEDMFRGNGSILDVLNADHTFLNKELAEFYGIANFDGNWQRYPNAQEVGRGGVLGMAAILAHASGASRTSPILRGNWVSETLLGERLPRPPANVPQLPEEIPTGLTERELIEQHSAVAECAKCHARIDPYGFALEQYDTTGRLRWNKANTKTKLFDGQTIEGVSGLRNYLANERRDDFVHQFCKKLLGYALGRETQLSDEPLLRDIKVKLAANDFRFHVAITEIVKSPQFRNIRGKAWAEE